MFEEGYHYHQAYNLDFSMDFEEGAANALQRGQACLRCRRRKMKCDGARPVCGKCATAKKPTFCEYDPPPARPKSAALSDHVAALEQRLYELESSRPTLFASTGPLVLRHAEDQPPMELAVTLIDLFTARKHQCNLLIDTNIIRQSLPAPLTRKQYPALTTAIFLWASFLSRPNPLAQHEERFLNMTVDILQDSLRFDTQIVDIILASCLLSQYYLATGRIVEGSYHLSTAAAAAETLRAEGLVGGRGVFSPVERLSAFWQAFNLDRSWSPILKKPAALLDEPQSYSAFNFPWPEDTYPVGIEGLPQSSQTVSTFLSGRANNGSTSLQSLRAKASALFHAAYQAANSREPGSYVSSEFLKKVQTLESTVTQLLHHLKLYPINQATPNSKPILAVTHTLTYGAMILLHRRFTQENPTSFLRCAEAATASAMVVQQLGPGDVDNLEPIVGHCWVKVAKLLVANLPASMNEVAVVGRGLEKLSQVYPVFAADVSQLRQYLS